MRLHIATIFQHRTGVVANLAERPKIGVSLVPDVFIAHMVHFVGGRLAKNTESVVEFKSTGTCCFPLGRIIVRPTPKGSATQDLDGVSDRDGDMIFNYPSC